MNEEMKRDWTVRAAKIRMKTAELVLHGNGGHIGGDLSETDLLVAVFELLKHDPKHPGWEGRDRFILSKGHSAEALYCVLAEYGYLSQKDLDGFGSFGTLLGGHPNRHIPGVEANTGSLGHGLALGVGMACAFQMDGRENRVVVLAGDGELAEGSNWEAAMAASKFRLGNLTWIIDRNHLQISGKTEDVMPLENLRAKAEAFGFETCEIDGHDFGQIYAALIKRGKERPVCVIADTVKGKGLEDAENQASWHHKTPNEQQVAKLRAAYRELCGKE